MIAVEVAVILGVAVLVAAFAPTPLVAVLICVSAVAVLYGSPHLVATVVAWWQRRAAVSEQRLADAIEKKAATVHADAQRLLAELPRVGWVGRSVTPDHVRALADQISREPEISSRSHAVRELRALAESLPTPRAGRHRRENAGPDAVSGTDNLRRANTAALERHRLMLAAAEADRHPAGGA